MTEYSGVPYVAIGTASGNRIYIYKDPLKQLSDQPKQAITPTQVLRVETPDYLSFSSNAQFIVTAHATQFGVYDIENKSG
ncbi:hypothetical protein LI003_23025, partial [Bacteroides caccae]|uniref:hypothetical protein n=1 Tax=Bacteroides caccae TaxID=47678 RepID=UPI001D069C1B